MIDQHYMDLINRKIDGTITDRENAELEEYLAGEGEARRLYDEMERLPDLIRQLDLADPPRDLKQRILESVDPKRYKSPPSRNRLSGLLGIFHRPAALRYVYSFAAGLLIGIAVYAVSVDKGGRRGNLDPRDVSGTIVIGGETGDFHAADRHRFELEGIAGSIESAVAGDVVLIRLSVMSAKQIELAFEYEPGALNFHGYRQRVAQSNSLEIIPGGLQMKHQGENEYMFVFENGAPSGTTVAFKIHSGELLYNCRIKTATGDSKGR